MVFNGDGEGDFNLRKVSRQVERAQPTRAARAVRSPFITTRKPEPVEPAPLGTTTSYHKPLDIHMTSLTQRATLDQQLPYLTP
jgi:hypothetical protein